MTGSLFGHLASKRYFVGAVSVTILVSLACGLFQPDQPFVSPTETAAPVTAQPVSASPTVPAAGHATGAARSRENGSVVFEDPVSDTVLTVTLKDEGSARPVAEIETWFVSNGTEVLVIAHDPSGLYPDTMRELRYSELSFHSPAGAKVAAPAQITLEATLLLITVVSLYEDFTKWWAFYNDFPDLETWSTKSLQYCVTPEQAKQGLGLGGDLLVGALTKDMFGPGTMEKALEQLFEQWGEEGTGDLVQRYASTDTPSIMRFTVYSFEDNVPQFLSMDGFCLEPLDRQDPQSSLRWLLYGVQQQELYPFRHLMGAEFRGYANYIEGGDPVTAERFMQDLESRLASSQVSCDGYAGSDGIIQVWTSGWSPPWQMTQLCYAGCELLSPPYESSVAGFLLFDQEGQWSLAANYLNTPDNYNFYPIDLMPCDQPERLELSSSPLPDKTTASSCPGAPPQRLSVKKKGYVCTQSDNVFLRSEPLRSGDILASLPPGTLFTVLEGPGCADNWSWWRVMIDQGQEGWISEGGDEIDPYFICPAE